MTYENVVSWCEKNKPQEEYDTFADNTKLKLICTKCYNEIHYMRINRND